MKFLVLNVLATAKRMEADSLGVTHLRNCADPSSSRVQRSTNYSPCLFPTKVLLPARSTAPPTPTPRIPPRSKPQTPRGSHPGCLNLQRGWRNRSPRGNASRRVNPSPAVPAAPLRRQRGPAGAGRRRVLPAERRGACCFLRGMLPPPPPRRPQPPQSFRAGLLFRSPSFHAETNTLAHTRAHTHK